MRISGEGGELRIGDGVEGRTDGVGRTAPQRGRTSAVSRRGSPRLVFSPAVLVIGASTGGPQALVSLVSGLVPAIGRLPICVTLHMPRDLMPVIASHVARRCGIPTKVVEGPCPLDPHVLHFSPGNRHLEIRGAAPDLRLALLPSASRDYCQPAVDVMFESAARTFGPRTLAVVLSGMGKDGLAGTRAIAAAGGTILVQDKATSAVWGMPGAVAAADLAAAVMAPEAIAREVIRRLQPGGVSR